jgi:hypothetical protein
MSSNDDMTIDRFADILSAYGGSAARWPAEERARAERLLHRSSDARDLLETESRLDRMLDMMAHPVPVDGTLRTQILDVAFGHPAAAYARAASSGEGLWGRLKAAWTHSGMLRPAGAALAASLMLGVVFGGMVGPASADPDPVDIMELALLDLTFTGY